MAYTDMHLFFDDVEVGEQRLSAGRTITVADIVNFAGLSGDFNPMHMDDAFAASTPFRRRIAHGLLVLSIGSGLILHSPPMRTIAFSEIREWKLLLPVFVGDTIHVRSEVLEKHEKARGRRGEILWRRSILNQEDKIVQEGTSITLVEGRGKRPEGTKS